MSDGRAATGPAALYLLAEPLRAIEPILACPACRGPLRLEGPELVDTVCAHRYPVRDGIARLALLGTTETWDAAGAAADSRRCRFDLLNLANSMLACMGTGYAPAALGRYGLDPAAITRVFAAVRGFRSSKFQRYRRRAEFIARGALSRTWGGRAGAPLGNEASTV